MSQHTLFISDLHLDESAPQITANFFYFLDNMAPKAETLYILGDLFEVWIGDRDDTPFNRSIIQAIKKFTDRGIPTYFMCGNRDFLIGKRFAKQTGMQLIKDPTVITLYGKTVYLAHGDALCTQDIQHQKTRKKMHNPFYQALVRLVPLCIVRWSAQRFRAKSKQRAKILQREITDVTAAEVTRVMTDSHTLTMIHGHTHRPAIHKIQIDGQAAKRIVLGAWYNAGNALVYQPSAAVELIDFNNESNKT